MLDRDDAARLREIATRTRATLIASLNDAFRRGTASGKLAITAGVIALGRRALPTILAEVQTFDRFTADNDPYGEHDFGSLTWQGELIFWKIDAYDSDMLCGSPDPTDPAVTTRVMTILLASEY